MRELLCEADTEIPCLSPALLIVRCCSWTVPDQSWGLATKGGLHVRPRFAQLLETHQLPQSKFRLPLQPRAFDGARRLIRKVNLFGLRFTYDKTDAVSGCESSYYGLFRIPSIQRDYVGLSLAPD